MRSGELAPGRRTSSTSRGPAGVVELDVAGMQAAAAVAGREDPEGRDAAGLREKRGSVRAGAPNVVGWPLEKEKGLGFG